MERLIDLTAETASLMVEVAKTSLPQGMGASELSIMKGLTESQKTLAGAMELQTRILDSQGDTPNNHPAGTIHNFRRLPAEIRNAIWEMALPDSRVFLPYLDCLGQPALIQYYKPPSLRGVCKESWAVTEKKGAFVFGNEGRHTYGIWFNYSKDIVAWLWEQFDNDWYIPDVKNIAIDSGHFSSRTGCIKTLKWLFSLNNDDVIWNVGVGIPEFWYQSSGYDDATWANMKKELELLYREDATLQRLGIAPSELPMLGAKEFLFSTKQT